MDVLVILKLIFWAFIVPFFLGRLIDKGLGKGEGIRISRCLCFGFAMMCALFQLPAVPMIIKGMSFHELKYLWLIITGFLFIVSFLIHIKDVVRSFASFGSSQNRELNTMIIWIAAILVIAFQVWLLGFHMHTDTDDARFLAEAVEAYEKDSMLKLHPITGAYLGRPYGEMLKDVTSPYPMFLALIGSLLGISPTIAAHFIMPFILIPLCYIVYYMIGDLFFDGDKKTVGIFLFVLSLIFLFSFGSGFASGYTLLTIVWQGRSVFLMIMLPLIWYMLLTLQNEDRTGIFGYIALITAVLAADLLSGMGVILSALICLAYALSALIQKKNIRLFAGILICIIPDIVYLMLLRMDLFG